MFQIQFSYIMKYYGILGLISPRFSAIIQLSHFLLFHWNSTGPFLTVIEWKKLRQPSNDQLNPTTSTRFILSPINCSCKAQFLMNFFFSKSNNCWIGDLCFIHSKTLELSLSTSSIKPASSYVFLSSKLLPWQEVPLKVILRKITSASEKKSELILDLVVNTFSWNHFIWHFFILYTFYIIK